MLEVSKLMRLKKKWTWDLIVDYPRAGGEEGQFLGQKEGKGWRLGKIVGKKADGLTLMGQIRIHTGRVFLHLVLSEGVKMKLWLVKEIRLLK